MRADRGEFARIRAIVRALPAGERVIVGPGDDAAVLRPRAGHDLVVTTDAFVEGRHWRPGGLDARGVGRRLAAANLSDLAAMAATPRWAVIAAAARPDAPPRALRDVERACAAALAKDGAAVVGGNLTATDGPSWWAVTLFGEVRRGRHWTRSGAKPGDVLAVTGVPGLAAAALAADAKRLAGMPASLTRRWASPPSRVPLALSLAATRGVHAAIDLSDGLAGDLAHLSEASGVGAVIDAEALPGDPALAAVARALARGTSAAAVARAEEALRFGPGDDYELLLAITPGALGRCGVLARRAGVRLSAIGRVTNAPGRLRLRRRDGEGPLPGRGHDHFRGRSSASSR